MSKCQEKLLVCSLFAVALVLALLAAYSSNFIDFIEQLSKGIARVDDLVVRLFGLALLIYGGILFLCEIRPMLKTFLPKRGKGSVLVKVRKTTFRDIKNGHTETVEEPKKDVPASPFKPFIALMKFGAVLGLSGASLFGAYELDKLDKGAYGWPPGQPPASVGPGSSGVTGGGKIISALPVGVSTQDGILARWVQVVPAGKQCWLPVDGDARDEKDVSNCGFDFLVRAVVATESFCPVVAVRYSNADPNKQVQNLELTQRENPNLDQYPVRVCERLLGGNEGGRSVRFPDGGTILAYAAWRKGKEPGKLSIFGDTGCRDNRDQDCLGTSWPFASLADDVTRDGPDLVIHVGDYIYGGGDHWASWQNEFFKPARRLLEAAPWIMVRGNHEDCGNDAPRGWLLFFDYRPDGVTDTCASTDKKHLVATYALDLNDKVRLVVADSSKAYLKRKKIPKSTLGCDKLENFWKALCERYVKVFGHVDRLASGWKAKDKKVWLTTHVPVFGLEENDDKAVLPETTAMMLAAWRANQLANKPDIILSGDRHLFQTVPASEDPLQVTIGTGGVNLDKDPSACPVSLPEKENWKAESDSRFGYLFGTLDGGKFEYGFKPLPGGAPGKKACDPDKNLKK